MSDSPDHRVRAPPAFAARTWQRSPASAPTTFRDSSRAGSETPRIDLELHQQYIGDIAENVRTLLGEVDPMPFYAEYGNNAWAAVKAYLDTVAEQASAPIIEKYADRLGAADVFVHSTAFVILESLRLDLGVGLQIHP